MNFKQCKYLINSDLLRLNYTPSIKNILKAIFFNYSFKITFWFRLGSFLQEKKGFIIKCLYRIVFLIYKHNQYLTGIQLPFGTKIGPGIDVRPFFVHCDYVIGHNREKLYYLLRVYNRECVGEIGISYYWR